MQQSFFFCVWQNLTTFLFHVASIPPLYRESLSRFCKKKLSCEFGITLYIIVILRADGLGGHVFIIIPSGTDDKINIM
jgi:hypothetical protein